MRRSVVFSVAGAALGLAVVLTLAGVGDSDDALTNGQALVLGIVQGLTELLPISSSGHLILVPWAAEWTYLEQNDRFNQTFDVAFHLGTLVAVAAYFWSDFIRLIRAWLGSIRRRSILSSDERVAWFVVVATIPAGLAGLLGADFIADNLGEPWQILILLAGGALLLLWADRGASDACHGRPRPPPRRCHGPRAGARARSRRLAVRDHDHGGPLHEARPRQRRAILVLLAAARPFSAQFS